MPILPEYVAFIVAMLAMVGGWATSLAWMAALAPSISSIVAPLALGGGLLLLSAGLFMFAGYASYRAGKVFRVEAAMAREKSATQIEHEHQLQDKLEQLGAHHDTMYALLFKSRRLSNLRVTEEEYDVRHYLLAAPEVMPISNHVEGDPSKVIPFVLQNKPYDASAAHRAASQMRDKSYSLRSFYVDVRQAFPELGLYVVSREDHLEGHTDITSGVSAEAEYRRTLGALRASARASGHPLLNPRSRCDLPLELSMRDRVEIAG